ncbi:diguanylate cyclase/phosphodiesterase [Arcobacter sp. L]|jgi:EAL domain-containing protein (putative c-di-GMP-specific phosphodiesterase class I)/GGDEF domain-containing protein|nr:diguanylate cyclase/phosphodiesterase [Arcobacter sp. L]
MGDLLIIRNIISSLFKDKKIKTLFLVDILYMKDLNAIYNFDNGDFIIKQLNEILITKTKNSIPRTLNRKISVKIKNTHADVFEILLYDDLTIEEIIIIKNLIYENVVSNDFKLLDKNLSINIDVTIGCSKSAEKQIKSYAEKALHEAKLNYLHYMYFDSFLYKNEFVNKDLLDILNHNINNNLVEPYFQAIMDNQSNNIVKYEALMRIFDKDGNMLMPNVFIHKAKKSRLYQKLMEILFDKIIVYIEKYKIHISVNLDYTDILNPQIKRTLLSKIKTKNVGSYITFEVLESEKVSNFNLVNDFIKEARIYGVRIAIDDFGTGFSNYENILNLDIDYIKIDGSLIKKIDEAIYLNLIKSIVLFSKQQNIKIVAEFVSDLKTLRYVKNIGIDFSQGYHIGKPMCIEELLGVKNEKKT